MAGRGFRIHGKVQGVFFRASTKSRAEDLGLYGWVQNETDGTVLIHAEGDNSLLNELEDWCNNGPEFAKVEEVEAWREEEEALETFEIRRN